MELNGVANLRILADEIHQTECYDNQDKINELVEKMETELVLLERYMIAYQKWSDDTINYANDGGYAGSCGEPPAWHEVKANPLKYPTNGER